MQTLVSSCARPLAQTARSTVLLATSATLLLFVIPVSAEEGFLEIVRVEEDWELVVASPDPNSAAPQVTTAIYPVGRSDSLYATFELNHQSQPEFVSGGMQLQLWDDEFPLISRKFPQSGTMAHAEETVRWTQTMSLDDGHVTFEIINGQSSTWGPFGGQGYLRATVTTDLADLNEYNPTLSVQNSGVGYAGNRVQSLVLKAVRLITTTGEVLEDSTVRQVHSQN